MAMLFSFPFLAIGLFSFLSQEIKFFPFPQKDIADPSLREFTVIGFFLLFLLFSRK